MDKKDFVWKMLTNKDIIEYKCKVYIHCLEMIRDNLNFFDGLEAFADNLSLRVKKNIVDFINGLIVVFKDINEVENNGT